MHDDHRQQSLLNRHRMMIPHFELTACAVVASEGMQRHTHPPRIGATETSTTCDTQAAATHHRRVRTLVDSLKRNGVPNWGPGQFSSVASPALLRLLRGIARWGLGDRLESGTDWGQVDRSADVRDLCADGLPGLYPWRYGGCGRLQPRVHEDADWLAAALTVAASTGETGIVRYLCELPADRGVDPAAHLNDAIVAAAWFGHVQVVRYLCELPADRGVDPAARNNAPIVAAAWRGHLQVVRYLCELPADRGVNPAARDNAPMLTAAWCGSDQVVQYLCELPACRRVNPSGCDCAPLVKAASRGHLQVVRYLCELPACRRVSPAARNNAPIITAARNGHVAIVRYLCELPADRGVNPGARNNSAIILAARNGHRDAVQYLCELPADRGVDPAARSNAPIVEAASFDRVLVARYLCELPADRGVDPAARNNFPIVEAAWSGRVQVVRYLCKQRGVDPWAGMIEAVKCGQLHVLRYLCEQYLPGHHDLPAVPSAVNRDVKPGGDIGPLRHRYPVNGHRRADTLFRIADVRCIRRYVKNAYPTAVPTNCRSHATLRSAARRPLLVLRTLLASSRATCLAARFGRRT